MTATMRAIKTSDAPTPFLVPDPKTGDVLITSDSAADHALRELAYISAHGAALNAKCDQETAAIRERCLAAQVVEIKDHKPIGYEARIAQLNAALERFVRAEYPTLNKPDGKRSVKFSHGRLCWSKARDAIQFARNGSAAKTIQLIDEATAALDDNSRGLIDRITRLVNTIRLFAAKPIRYVGLVVSLKPSIDRSKTLKNYQAKLLSNDDLAELGLKFVSGGDVFQAKPNAFEISNREGS